MLARSTHSISSPGFALLVTLLAGATAGCGDGKGGNDNGTDSGSATDGTSAGTDGTAGTGGTATDSGSASGNSSASGGSGSTGGGSAGTDTTTGGGTCEGSPTLAVEKLDSTAISDMGLPFDESDADQGGPYAWGTNYGKQPEMIPFSDGDGLHILWRDHTEGAAPTGHVVRVEGDGGGGYSVTAAYRVELLSNLMGFTRDTDGNYYYATGVDEGDVITVDYPADGEHRPDIVRVVKFDPAGCVVMESDVDMEREKTDPDSEAIINPMVAASSRLAWGAGNLALVHGINTDPDDNDVRHQKAITTHIDAQTGAVNRTSSFWVSHSFDQRLLWDGSGFIELHLGDAFPRALAFGRATPSDKTSTYEIFDPKGDTGENATYTRLGGVVQVSGDFGYVVVFATDRSPDLPTEQWATVQGTRDLAMIRVRTNFADLDPDNGSFVDESADTQMVVSSGNAVTNHLKWLTDYGDGITHADRPRVVNVGGDQLVVLWERWEKPGQDEQFTGTWALTIDGATGAVTEGPTEVSDHHIVRGDDAVALDGNAVFVTGHGGTLNLEIVSPDLSGQTISLP